MGHCVENLIDIRLLMVNYIKEVSSMGFTMVKVLLKRKMERSILVFSAMVESMGKEKSITQMVITTRVNGKMT